MADVDAGGRGAATRRAVLAAAIERFGRDGYRATAVTAIARDAGVGGTVPYQYFATKEALFLEAADEDTAGVIGEIFDTAGLEPHHPDWPGATLAAAVDALERHPLARRILAGLEPDAAERVLNAAALADARKVLATTLSAGQATGAVRSDVAADDLASGLIGIFLALLAAGLRFGLGDSTAVLSGVLVSLHAAVVPGRSAAL